MRGIDGLVCRKCSVHWVAPRQAAARTARSISSRPTPRVRSVRSTLTATREVAAVYQPDDAVACIGINPLSRQFGRSNGVNAE